MRSSAFLCFLALAAPSCFAGIVVGGPGTNISGFPFGYAADGFGGTVFDEVYAASEFPSAITISSIGLFAEGGTYRPGSYGFYLATTVSAPDWLLAPPFGIVPGADQQLFGTYALSGPAPHAKVIFAGSPFSYDPAQGNLLLTIRYSGPGGGDISSGAVFVDSGSFDYPYSGETVGVAWDYGGNYFNHGLVTEFETSTVPEPSGLEFGLAGLLFLASARFWGRVRETPD